MSIIMKNLAEREKRAKSLDLGTRNFLEDGLWKAASMAGLPKEVCAVKACRTGDTWKGHLRVSPGGLSPLEVFISARMNSDAYVTVFIDRHSDKTGRKSVNFSLDGDGNVVNASNTANEMASHVVEVMTEKSKSVFSLFCPCG